MEDEKRKDPMLDYLKKTSRQNRVERRQLCRMFTMSSRGVEAKIQRYRSKGYPIIAETNGKGYFFETDPAELEKWLVTYTAYARSIMKNSKAMREGIKEFAQNETI